MTEDGSWFRTVCVAEFVSLKCLCYNGQCVSLAYQNGLCDLSVPQNELCDCLPMDHLSVLSIIFFFF